MVIITIVCLIIFAVVFGISVFMGLDLKRTSSWLFGLCGFICGFVIGLVDLDVLAGLQLGVIFTFIIMFGGAIMRLHNQRNKN